MNTYPHKYTLKDYVNYLLVIVLLNPSMITKAQDSVYLQRVNIPILPDGIISENEWGYIKPANLTMHQPTFRGKITEKTEIKIAYDENYLYVVGYFYDSKPDGIRTNSLYRDDHSDDDTFGLIIDTFNDKENALWFRTNPAGIRSEAAISGDGNSVNWNWNTYWTAATTINEKGWFAEMRIPFSSLGFNKESRKTKVGIIIYRYIARKNEIAVYPAISNNYLITMPSRAQESVLENINTAKPIYITPYVVGGLGKSANLDEGKSKYTYEDHYIKDIGLDIKYNITNNLTLDATFNTDFAQLEADNQQINLTRFSLFFPEKRQFFQERSGIFSFNTSVWTNNRLFHSRQIGIQDDKLIRILGGGRLIGRINKWDIGIINMQTEKSDELPSENFGIFRFRRQVLNENSYAGSMITSRLGSDGSYNVVYGLDANLRLFGNDYFIFKWAQSFDDELIADSRNNFLSKTAFQVQYRRRNQEGLHYNFAVSRAGENYNPEMGYASRYNFTEYFWNVGYDWFMGESSRFRQVSPIQIFGFMNIRNKSGKVESAQLEYDTDLYWKSGSSIWMDIEYYYENLEDTLFFSGNSFIPAGEYRYPKLETGYNMSNRNRFQLYPGISLGRFYDGWRYELNINNVWNISKHLNIEAYYEVNFIRLSDWNQGFNSHITRLRLDLMMNKNFSIRSFAQYNSIADLVVLNVRLRYNFSEGNDLWLVYNENLNTDRYKYNPVLPGFNSQVFMVKYTYTFQQ
ncbi:MAG: DUF5916 domain-containing protein [Ignavibacteria bacterium]